MNAPIDAKLKQDLDAAIHLLKKTVKPSTATDEFKHIDLTLVAASQKAKYEAALMLARKCILDGVITKEQFDTALGLK
ncbi:MAG: hypothetical protein JNM93_06420 [Bacteriovoracaceae bacterium]|nr:hypothetical protein [Bacteriovoracaceae bacterium]